ncbi:Radical SAM domain protein [Pyrolobus fumarii 1A]|uniref:Radical SAM domain protein n=1 Tax=Pyrolobus fumarii (strain DSM 11204 / 1A) TaxID=694429 RepID=G0EHR0_PYRF1|nr:radical SAM protein [Pyrolobus fumarii]AEM39413.1 Radical SAM domain protein [Pyrolobus fumarii 1A]
MLDEKEIREAQSDGHARREPRPCGMTIHTGIGCKFGCVYCYVPDMGFPMKPRPYPLNGLQLVYALLSNPFFVPGPYGTLLAFGSVTEPFMEETVERALEYLEATSRYLRNPIQLSTKAYIDESLATEIHQRVEPHADFLVTIITLRLWKRLEPNTPPPEKRFETISNLSKIGIHVTLFLRPIIPGVTDKEVPEILARAKAAGAAGVVPGSLRVTPGILHRLKLAGIDTRIIEARLPRRPRSRRDQVTIKERDLKRMVEAYAAKVGLRVYPSSCSANVDSHGISCYACKWGPCGNPHDLPEVTRDGIEELGELLGLEVVDVRVGQSVVRVSFRGRVDDKRLRVMKNWVEALTKRAFVRA